MFSIDDYLDEAARRTGLSGRGLATRLGKSPGVVCQWRTKRSWPSDETMLELAKIVEVEPATALLHLNYWRTEGEARSVYARLVEAARPAALGLALYLAGHLFFAMPSTAYAAEMSQPSHYTIYYGKYVGVYPLDVR